MNIPFRFGLSACLQEAGRLFSSWIEDPAVYLGPDTRSLVYRYGMGAVGGPDTWDTVLARYQAETNAQEKRKLLYGLAQVSSNTHVKAVCYTLHCLQVREPWVLDSFIRLGWFPYPTQLTVSTSAFVVSLY